MIHIVQTPHSDDFLISKKNIDMLVKTVTESFVKHEAKIKENSAYPEIIAGKLLVTNSGLDEMDSIKGNEYFKSWCGKMCIKPFFFSSREGSTSYDFEEERRERMLEMMNKLGNSDRSILFHYDILTEGIDLPSITGVMLLRETITDGKLIQNLGRACRLHKIDRTNLYSGKIDIGDYSAMIKPYSWVILPKYINNNWGAIENTVRYIRNSYGIMVDHVSITDISTTPEKPDLKPVTEQTLLNFGANREIEHIFEDIIISDMDNVLVNIANKETYLIATLNCL